MRAHTTSCLMLFNMVYGIWIFGLSSVMVDTVSFFHFSVKCESLIAEEESAPVTQEATSMANIKLNNATTLSI